MTQLIASRLEASVSGRTFAAQLRADLARANLSATVGEFLILQASAAAICGALAFFISRAPAVACFFAAVGWLIPKFWLGRRKAARLKAFNDQLADTIALMSNSLRAGMSLLQSMEMITREAEPPVSEEFHRVVREVGLGVGPQEALVHMVQRIDSEDLDLLITAILVQFEIGGNLSRILDSISNTIRERVKLHGEIRTLSAQGRMSGYILSGMPLAIGGLLMLIAPSYMGKLFSPGPWLALPVLAVIGVAVGTFVLRQLVAIEV
jgi:tight adherence protein B